jgi:hypothetical protein
MGLKVIPLVPKHKYPATAWDTWLKDLSPKKIAEHWAKNPNHEVGCIVGSDLIVFDADSPQATAALLALELKFNVSPGLVVKTKKGIHHYFRRAKGVYARSDSHSTERYPERLDIKTGRALIILPPSTGKMLVACEVSQVCELRVATQDFIDAIFIHNGKTPVRPLIPPPESTPSVNEGFEPVMPVLAHIKALTDHIDPDIGYDDWLRALMAIFNSAGGTDAGLALADRWSSKGSKYKGLREIEAKWRSFRLDAPRRVTIATLHFMVEANGYDWLEVCAAGEDESFETFDTEIFEPDTAPVDAHSTVRRMMTNAHPLTAHVATDDAAQVLPEAFAAAIDEAVISPESESEIVARLAAMKQQDYDRIRKSEAKALGVQVTTLDGMVKAARDEDSASERLPFVEVEPHADPIDPALVLDEVVDIILRYVVMDKTQAEAAALWITMTWFIDDVEVAALAIITAPEKSCGKSQLLTIFGYLAARPLSAANSTASFLFRAITAWRPTLLVDEADTFIRENDELKGLVNAGHTRANAFVGRTVSVGDGYEPRMFDVWGAKAFAGISLEKHLPDATMSRGIVISLRRKMAHEKVDRLRHADKTTFAATASKLARFAEDYSEQVRAARPVLPDELSDRSQDNWESLLAIAGCAGPAWRERATRAALALSGTAEATVSAGNELLADIQYVFEQKRTFKISTVDLIEALVSDEERAWATYNRGKPLSPRQLAKQLGAYGIKPKTVRLAHGTPKGYDADQFTDAFARYLSTSDPQVPDLAAPEKLLQQRNALPGVDPAMGTPDGAHQDHAGAIAQLDCGGVADTNQTGGEVSETNGDGAD